MGAVPEQENHPKRTQNKERVSKVREGVSDQEDWGTGVSGGGGGLTGLQEWGARGWSVGQFVGDEGDRAIVKGVGVWRVYCIG